VTSGFFGMETTTKSEEREEREPSLRRRENQRGGDVWLSVQ